MITRSPLIKDGVLALSNSGDLIMAPDIETQATITLSAYNCIYDNNLNSRLIPYLNSIPKNGINTNNITNIITSAYQPTLLKNNVISDLKISVVPVGVSYINIKINMIDYNNNQVLLNWDNTAINN